MVSMTRYRYTFWVTTKSPLKQTASVYFRKLSKLPNLVMHLHNSRFWFNLMGIFPPVHSDRRLTFFTCLEFKTQANTTKSLKNILTDQRKSMNFTTIKPTKLLDFLLPLSLSQHDFSKISLEGFFNFTEQSVFCGYLLRLFCFTTVLSLSCPAWLTHIKISECLATSNFKLDKER